MFYCYLPRRLSNVIAPKLKDLVVIILISFSLSTFCTESDSVSEPWVGHHLKAAFMKCESKMSNVDISLYCLNRAAKYSSRNLKLSHEPAYWRMKLGSGAAPN